MNPKTRWVKFTMIAYATVVVQVPEGEDMIGDADEMAFDGCLSPEYQLQETRDFEILESEPTDADCRRNEIGKTPMTKRELDRLQAIENEGGSK